MALQSQLTTELKVQDVLKPTINLLDQGLSLVPSLGSFNQGYTSLANGAVGVTLPLGDVTSAHTLLLNSTQPLTVFINGEVTGHLCTQLMLTGCAITALAASNASGQNAIVEWAALGA